MEYTGSAISDFQLWLPKIAVALKMKNRCRFKVGVTFRTTSASSTLIENTIVGCLQCHVPFSVLHLVPSEGLY
jgi:hypothetical protein